MSTQGQGYWQPPGLSALQTQLSFVLSHLDREDYTTALDAMKRLALITAEIDIIDQTELFCQATEQQIQMYNSTITLSEVDKLGPSYKKQVYLKQRSYELLKLIMKLCNKHGITIKHPKDIASNSNRSSQLLEE